MRAKKQKNTASKRRSRQTQSDRGHLRFQINGVIHEATRWTLDGFSVKPAEQGNIHEGDAFLVTGIGCGNEDLVPVFLRGEAVCADDTEVSVKFVHEADRDRNALEDFLVRSHAFDDQSDAA